MGSGCWTSQAYANTITRSFNIDSNTAADVTLNSRAFKAMDTSEVYKSRNLHKDLNPYKVIRECCDSDEHPNTIPVILALDVTGSMGGAARACAAQLNEIMTTLYSQVKDVQFMTMGIGDLACDDAPIQASQFESDIRILDQLMLTYFEGGGGGNGYESYTAAWYFGLHNCKLDCWNRGKKGIIITLGDEPLNPYLPGRILSRVLGCPAEDVKTEDLYNEVIEKFDVYHIAINEPESSYSYYSRLIDISWGSLLKDHLIISNLNELPIKIANIVSNVNTDSMQTATTSVNRNQNGEITW